MDSPRVDALCCVCGARRTVSLYYSRRQDPNHESSAAGQSQGWRETETLKCGACGERTRHALLKVPGRRDYDEIRQRLALGDTNTGLNWSDEYVRQLRREYRELFPRNPNLHHRYNVDAATKAWDEGHKQVSALCGEPCIIDTDPRTWSSSKKKREENNGFIVAEQFGDTEYEDPDTGLGWIDMDCVDCCRVSNDLQCARQRERLEWYLMRFASRPELIDDADVSDVLQCLEKLYEQTRETT